jgi:serine/threonine protein kinase/tetratricopeptide (TPR) repeat protein
VYNHNFSQRVTASFLRARADTEMVGKTLLHYRIIKELGKGGMGVVYKAEDQKLHRVVALKVLLANLVGDEKARKRFLREARAASAIDHPNICTVYEINETPNMLFFVMQFVEGATLKKTINGRPMPIEVALEVALQLTDALAEAHSHGIIHRDIKSSNIVMTERGQPKILDFGLAKLTEPQNGKRRTREEIGALTELTQRGVPFGTASYMSPEQAQGEPADHRSDIYSLGVVVYEMVTGRLPFRGKTSIDVMHAVIHDTPPPLPETIPPLFARVIERALAKSPGDRFQTAAEMLDELKRAARIIYTTRGDMPVGHSASLSAVRPDPRPSTIGRAVRWMRRNLLGGLDAQATPSDEPSHDVTVESAETSRSVVSGTTVRGDKRAIAILPFKNLSGETDSDFYGFSLADSVITELAQLKSLIVRPSTYVAKYQNVEVDPRQVGMELAVDSVLVGSYIKSGDRFRVTPQLIDISTGEIIWSDKIDLESKDLITLQDKISQHIVDGLRIRISDQEQNRLVRAATNSHEAYELYLRARSLLNTFVTHSLARKDLDGACDAYKAALDLDPEFTLAWSGLGVCYSTYVMKGMGGISYYDEAEAACKRALDLDPKLVEPRVTLVYIYMSSGDKQKARELVQQLRREAPNDTGIRSVAGTLYRLDGRYEEALREWDRQLKINPTEIAPVSYNKARIYMYRGEYDAAIAEIDTGRAVEPDHPLLKAFLAEILYYQGKLDEAAAMFEDVFEAAPSMRGLMPMLGWVYHARGEKDRAMHLVDHDVVDAACADHDIAYWLASLYAIDGDRGEALTWLERAVELGNENFPWFERDPNWDLLRDDPAYQELLSRLRDHHEESLKQ